MSVFVSNGLLGAGLPKEPTSGSLSASFVPNGLLSTPSESSSSSLTQHPDESDTGTNAVGIDSSINESSQPITRHFVANGLLSSGRVASDSSRPSLATLSPCASTSAGIPRVSIHARTFNGRTVTIRRRSKPVTTRPSSTERLGSLLDVPIHRLMDELSAATATKLAEQNLPGHNSESSHQSSPEDTLWVDRYRPRRYIELTGNERVARETMTWVKLWDWCVFGKSKGKKRSRDGEEDLWDNDDYHRPRDKLLLLSGPPGLGKTTLAHVVARQAGYEVMEINASDARSGQIVDDRIRPTLEAGSTIGSKKPVLLIIDEIDGATGTGDSSSTFIHKLVQLTQFKPKKRRNGQKPDPNSKKPILRPIICICNDYNAASLAKLRPHAYQIRFTRPADVHTVKRLRAICDAEGLKAETRALGTLVGIARGDLRSCLNTLQFVKSRNEEVTEAVIRRATAGMREADSTISSVLNSLFSPLSRKRVKELGMTEDQESKYVARLSQEIDAVGRESSIATGCFAHYATLKQHDANFSRYEKANEWLGAFDFMTAAMYSEGEFALSPYIPYMLIPFHPLFQERGAARVERSQADWEHQQTTKANEEIYKTLSGCLCAATSRLGGAYRQFMFSPLLEVEFAPYINRIISPPLRPVNSQVIRPEERALLSRLVDIMASLELRFVQERAEDGQLTYRLDPPIDVFINYDGKRAADIAVTRYAVRHLVSNEIEAKLSGRRVDAVEKGKRSGLRDFFGTRDMAADMNATPSSQSEDNADLPPAKRTKTDIADKPPTDFFGRPIDVSSLAAKRATKRKTEKQFRITYRFAEGNSAAVRKPVKLDSFL